MRKVQFIILRNAKGEFYTRVRFPNGRIYASTEGYKRKLSLQESNDKLVKCLQSGTFKTVDKTLTKSAKVAAKGGVE